MDEDDWQHDDMKDDKEFYESLKYSEEYDWEN